MARALLCLAAAASIALLASPAAAQSAGDAGLRYLSWPGRPAQTATPQPSSSDYGLRGADYAPADGATRRPDRYSGGGDRSLQTRYYERRQAQSSGQPRYEEPQPEPRYEAASYEPRYQAPPRLTQPSAPQQPRPEQRPEPRYEPRYEQQQPAQTIQIQPPSGGYAPRAAAEQPPVRQQAETQPQPQSQTQSQAQSQPTSGQPAASGDSVRYYSVHRGAGRQPDPIQQTYVSPQDAMVALAPPTGTSLAERQRQATADEVALSMIRQLPPEQLALLLDTPQ